MSKIVYRVAFPILLSAIFTITIFIAMEYQRLNPSFYIIALLVMITIFFFGYAIGERLSSPLEELKNRADELSNGDFSKRIYLGTKDEMEDLAQIYNKMAEALESVSEREKNTESSVDMKVRAKTQSLEEIINALEQKIKNRSIEGDRILKDFESLQTQIKQKDTEISSLKKELEDCKSRT